MKLLLDTHVYLWWLKDPAQLEENARIAIANARSIVFVSAASMLEIVIKETTGKLKVDEPPETKLQLCRFHELPLTFAHAAAMRELPAVHKDPFDRMLVAQARVDGLTLVSRDPVMQQYGVDLIAA